jgi:hypothetical protein
MVEELKAWGAGLGARGGFERTLALIPALLASQARHESVAQSGTCASRIVVPRRRRNDFSVGSRVALVAVLGLALAGCSSVPHTTIAGKLNGSPFLIEAPKDGDLTGFDLTADSNGVVRVHIDHLAVKMNPDVIGQNGTAQAGIIQATGVVASNITAAAVGAALRAN